MSILDGDYELAIKVVLESSNASCSHLQRKLNWNYARASLAIDRMEREFIVGAMSTTGKRDVLPPCVHELWEKAQQQEKEIQVLKIGGVPEGFVLVPFDVVDRCMSHIVLAQCHPNNTSGENDVMEMDLKHLEQSIEQSQGPSNEHQ